MIVSLNDCLPEGCSFIKSQLYTLCHSLFGGRFKSMGRTSSLGSGHYLKNDTFSQMSSLSECKLFLAHEFFMRWNKCLLLTFVQEAFAFQVPVLI